MEKEIILKWLSGSGSGYGYGDGSGDGYGYGDGDGSGDGSGDGRLKSYNHRKVYYIDGAPTLIDSVRGGFAKGYMVNKDKTLSPCFIARQGNSFAHGFTMQEAHADAFKQAMEE